MDIGSLAVLPPATLGTTGNATIAQSGTWPAGITLNTTTGAVSVAAGTAPGKYPVTYQLCDKLTPVTCAIITDTVTVSAVIYSIADNGSALSTGGLAISNIAVNDSINGYPATLGATGNATVAQSGTWPVGITLNPLTGAVNVAYGTLAGTYSMVYNLCDKLTPPHCDTVRITVTVIAPAIVARNDFGSANGYNTNLNVLNVLQNDSFNNQTAIVPVVKITVVSPASHPGVTLNTATGAVGVAAGTPAGVYSIIYRICDSINVNNCAISVATITVTAPTIIATPNTGSVNSYNGNANLLNVLGNDSINGVVASAGRVNLSVVVPAANAGIVLNPATGNVSVAPGVPAGVYTIIYKICDTLNTTNCVTSSITITVNPPSIIANPNAGSANGYNGNANLLNVLSNDAINGNTTTLGSVNLSLVTPAANNGVTLNLATGIVGVAPGTPAGIYTIIYKICDTLNTSNCDTSIVTITVTPPVITANADAISINGANGGANLLNVLSNDSINGASATTSNVTISIVSAASNAGIILNPTTGLISVAPNTPAGVYTIVYRICDKLNPSNCTNATITITVTAPLIIATPDVISINGHNGGGNLINVLANDSINGHGVNTGSVVITIVNPASNAGVVLNPITGNVSVAPGTPAGTYTITYRICDSLNVSNCSITTITVTVIAPVIIANPDYGTVNGYSGMANLIQVITNDSINKHPTSLGPVVATVISAASNAGVVLNPITGFVSVAPRTPAGLYTIIYRICDSLNPSNCDTSIVRILVTATGPVANADNASTGQGKPVVISPLSNDSDADGNLNRGSIRISIPPSHGIATIDTLTGLLTYKPDTGWFGSDTLIYSVCDSGMTPVLCDTAMIVFKVIDRPALNSIFVAPALCFGDSSGFATVKVKGGVPPYSYSWNTIPVQTGDTAYKLQAGVYVVSITDAINQTFQYGITVSQPLVQMSASITPTMPKCYSDINGSLDLSVNGGTAPYTYVWNNGNTNQDLINIISGNYSVVVKDANGCNLAKNIFLDEPQKLTVSALEIQDVLCKGEPEGFIKTDVLGGTKPYTYAWNSGDTLANIFNKPDGTYKLVVTDTNACFVNAEYVINYSRVNCDQKVFIPDGFSPNGDGNNDAFTIDGIEKYPNNYLRIYNRWGGMVYDAHGYKNTWEGTINQGVILQQDDDKLPTGTYFYVLELESGMKAISGYIFISK